MKDLKVYDGAGWQSLKGPPGPSKPSADAGNLLKTGSDGLLMLPQFAHAEVGEWLPIDPITGTEFEGRYLLDKSTGLVTCWFGCPGDTGLTLGQELFNGTVDITGQPYWVAGGPFGPNSSIAYGGTVQLISRSRLLGAAASARYFSIECALRNADYLTIQGIDETPGVDWVDWTFIQVLGGSFSYLTDGDPIP